MAHALQLTSGFVAGYCDSLQLVSLSVSDADHSDPDLYLYDATGSTILASSVGTGTYEQVAIPQNGQYIALVEAASGAHLSRLPH